MRLSRVAKWDLHRSGYLALHFPLLLGYGRWHRGVDDSVSHLPQDNGRRFQTGALRRYWGFASEISWPSTEERARCKQVFGERGFPDTVGCVDGSTWTRYLRTDDQSARSQGTFLDEDSRNMSSSTENDLGNTGLSRPTTVYLQAGRYLSEREYLLDNVKFATTPRVIAFFSKTRGRELSRHQKNFNTHLATGTQAAMSNKVSSAYCGPLRISAKWKNLSRAYWGASRNWAMWKKISSSSMSIQAHWKKFSNPYWAISSNISRR